LPASAQETSGFACGGKSTVLYHRDRNLSPCFHVLFLLAAARMYIHLVLFADGTGLPVATISRVLHSDIA
jgi:hypothetical protein